MEHSENITNFAEAFSKFQAEITDPKLDADTDYKTKDGRRVKFKYSSLAEILRTIRPVLSKHGIALLQEPKTEGNEVSITTILLHSSGEWVKFEPLKMRAQSAYAQEIGSAITYGRRYNISSVLGIGAEEDDDGNAAQNGIEGSEPPPEAPKAKKVEPIKEEPKKEEPKMMYVRQTPDNDILIKYPTYDDATKFKTPQKWLSISGFNETQCKYALNHEEYKQAHTVIEARLSELQKE